MYITVHGTKTKARVSESGEFYVESYPSIHTSTLKGLEKKLNAKPNTNSPMSIAVEHKDGRVGTAYGFGVNYFRVKIKWNGGGRSIIHTDNLRRPMTPDQKAHYNSLDKTLKEAESALSVAEEEFSSFEQLFDLSEELRQEYNARASS